MNDTKEAGTETEKPVAEKNILYNFESEVATITLNRPTRLNAVTFPLLGELDRALKQASEDWARAIV